MKKSFLLNIILMLSIMPVCAQSNLDFNYQVYYQTTSQDTAMFDSLCNRICEVHLSDTINISQIHINVGTEEGLSDILNYSFAWDITSGLPSGLAYFRNEFVVYLTLFQTYISDMYYYEVYLEDTYGNISSTKTWQ